MKCIHKTADHYYCLFSVCYRRAESFEKRVQQLSEEMEEQMERDRQRIFEKEGNVISLNGQWSFDTCTWSSSV